MYNKKGKSRVQKGKNVLKRMAIGGWGALRTKRVQKGKILYKKNGNKRGALRAKRGRR